MKHLALVITIALGNCVATESDQPLHLTQTIALSGVEGRIDHLAFDAAGERLFVCALGNNSVEVIDLRKAERIYSIIGLGVPQGIAYIPQLDRLFVANDKGGIFKIYDARSLQQIGELNFKDDADNLRYDNATKKVYVGFGSGGLAVVSAPDGKQIGSIKLSAHPEAFELEKQGKRIFVNVPNAWQVAVVDRDKGEVVATWKTGWVFGNFPMALDEANHRLFIGCRLSSKLIVLNTDSGEVVTKVDISGDSDDLFTTASDTAFTRSVALERSTSSSRGMQTPIRSQRTSTRRSALAPDFLNRSGIAAVEALFFLKRGMGKSPERFVVTGLPFGDLSWQTEKECSADENKQDNSNMLAADGQHQSDRHRPLVRGRSRYGPHR
jgi:DNA-binding beta-propeller fold protein YncE